MRKTKARIFSKIYAQNLEVGEKIVLFTAVEKSER